MLYRSFFHSVISSRIQSNEFTYMLTKTCFNIIAEGKMFITYQSTMTLLLLFFLILIIPHFWMTRAQNFSFNIEIYCQIYV
jgi:hypothetical protein